MRPAASVSAWLVAPTVRAAGADGSATPDGGGPATVLDAGVDGSATLDGGGPATDAPVAPEDASTDAPAQSSDAPGPAESGPPLDGGCTSPPVLRSNDAGTIPCQLGADGGALVCTTGTQCCDGAMIGPGMYAANDCEPWGTVCSNGGAGGLPLECNQVADCTANGGPAMSACCLVGATTPALVLACGYYKSIGGQRVVCETNIDGDCGSGEINVCSSDRDCPGGMTCTPMDWKIFQFGVCM